MIFVATHTYTLGKVFGHERAVDELHKQIQNADNKSLPCVRTIARLRTMDELILWNDSGATRLAESRSRAFHEGLQQLKSPHDVWFAVDDDCECTIDTLRWMLEAVRSSKGVCVAPYWARSSDDYEPFIVVNLPVLEPGQRRQFRELTGGGFATQAKCGGMGLIAIAFDAMRSIALANEEPRYCDRNKIWRRALFLEFIRDGLWLGEDSAFFARIPPNVTVEALASGITSHNSERLDLGLIRQSDEILSSHTPQQSIDDEPAPETMH